MTKYVSILTLVLTFCVGSAAHSQQVGYTAVYTDDTVLGSATGVYERDGRRLFTEFNLAAIGSESQYFFSISPSGIFAGPGVLASADMYFFQGDGSYNGDEVATTFLSAVNMYDSSKPIGVAGGWYTSDGKGGFLGDQYFDVTSVVSNAQANGWSYLGFSLDGIRNDQQGIVVRNARLTNYGVPSSAPASSVPEVSATGSLAAFATLFALMALLWERQRKPVAIKC